MAAATISSTIDATDVKYGTKAYMFNICMLEKLLFIAISFLA